MAAQLLAWPGSVMLGQDYPANTVRGRLCLGLRLDWDRDSTKETSDVYIKPRMIVLALTFNWATFMCWIIRR